jgi:hypothetical protein
MVFQLNPRIRDFVVTQDNWIFSVVSYSRQSDSKVEALLRYVPDENGERIKYDGTRFHKMDFDESFNFLRTNKPEYIEEDIHRVPFSDIKEVLRPEFKIKSLLHNPQIKAIVDTFKERGIPISKMGITGSWLCDLATPSSDIDFIVYGKRFFDAIAILKKAKIDGRIAELDYSLWRRIYEKRVPEISFDEFLMHEMRKGNRGMVEGKYFDLLYVNDYENPPFYKRGKILGECKIEAVVTDASLAFDSPALFKVDHNEIKEVLSFTHTYVGQVMEGELMEARGVLEEGEDGIKRLIVGTTREARGEWIRSLTLMEDR